MSESIANVDVSEVEVTLEMIELARMLHYTMEKLDPTDDLDWDQMSDHRREFYVLCVRSLIKSSEFQAVYQRKPAAT